jgi:hypothetical protein
MMPTNREASQWLKWQRDILLKKIAQERKEKIEAAVKRWGRPVGPVEQGRLI